VRVDFEGAGSLASHIVKAQPRGTDDDGGDPCDGNCGTQGYFEHAHSLVSSSDAGACRINATTTQRSCEEHGRLECRNRRRHVPLWWQVLSQRKAVRSNSGVKGAIGGLPLPPQGKRMKVCDPIAGVLLGRARAPKPCGTQQRAGSQSRLWTDLWHQ